MGNRTESVFLSKHYPLLSLTAARLTLDSLPLLLQHRDYLSRQQLATARQLAARVSRRANPSLLQLLGYEQLPKQVPCQSVFRLRLLFEYASEDLHQRTNERRTSGREFQQQQLTEIAERVCEALGGLLQQGREHGAVSAHTILFCNQVPKLCPPELLQQSCVRGAAVPEQAMLCQRALLADLFRLGLVLLECATMIPLSEGQCSHIRLGEARLSLASSENYSLPFKSMLLNLLAEQEHRPSLQQLARQIQFVRRRSPLRFEAQCSSVVGFA